MRTSEDTTAAASVAFKLYVKTVGENSLGHWMAFSRFTKLQALPPDHANRALELICQPVINPLQEIIQQGETVLQQVPVRLLTVHIDRLSCIFRWSCCCY